jgi:general secretion pathway protein H
VSRERTYWRLRSRRADRGFTLIEIMVVLAIMAMVAGLGISGFRALRKSDLRGSSAQLAGALRILFDRASTTGKYHRLVFDLDNGRYWAEVSDDRFFIPHEAETVQQQRKREADEADEDQRKAEEEERAAARSGSSSLFGGSGGSGGASGTSGLFGSSGGLPSGSSFDYSKLDIGDFRPRRARFAAFKESSLKPVTLKKKVKLRSVYTPRTTEPVTSGRAYVYFFPLGQTEPAIITLSDESGESVYSLVVHPITGRVRVYNQEVRPPSAANQQYDDEGNRVVQ